MPLDRPTRLRRQPLGGTSDPFDHVSGLPTQTAHGGPIFPSAQGQVGLVGGEATSSTSPALGRATAIAGNFKDLADVAKQESPRVNEKSPFTLHD